MATKKTGASGMTAPLDPKVAGKLLDKLGTDNVFRRLFKKDPLAALKQVGYREADAGTAHHRIAHCMKVERIAPKADVLESREALLEHLTGGLAQTPIQLNVSSTAARRIRK